MLFPRFSDWRAPAEAAPARQQSLSANQRAWQQGHSSVDGASTPGGGSFGGLSYFVSQTDNSCNINMGAYPQQGAQDIGRPQPVQVLSPLLCHSSRGNTHTISCAQNMLGLDQKQRAGVCTHVSSCRCVRRRAHTHCHVCRPSVCSLMMNTIQGGVATGYPVQPSSPT